MSRRPATRVQGARYVVGRAPTWLRINAVYAKPYAPLDTEAGQAIAGAIEELADVLSPLDRR